jgi:N utilization substance protein A
VFTSDFGIDAVGSCVGVRGARVQAVINELGGEKIDVIQWSPDLATTVVSALSPAEVSKVIIDDEGRRIEVVVPDEQLNIAIGKRGQNVRLASKLIGWDIDVLSEDSESKRRNEEFVSATAHLIAALDVEEILAQLLVSEGYVHVRNIVAVAPEDIAGIEGLDMDIAQELIARATDYISENPKAVVESTKKAAMRIERKVMALSGMTAELGICLVEGGAKSLQDVADLSSDEFDDLLSEELRSKTDRATLDAIIMEARNRVYFGKK